jgi:hypothetical protein
VPRIVSAATGPATRSKSFFKGCKEWDYPGAGQSIRRALVLNPG